MQGKVAHYVFVASAGAYKSNKIEPALFEGDARKDSAGHVAVEKYLEQQVRLVTLSKMHPLDASKAYCQSLCMK